MDALIFVLPDFCNPSNYILYAQHSGPHVDPVTYYWSTTETTEYITVPGTAGTYTVTVTDNVGCTATDEVTITDPAQFFYIIEGYNLCEGQQAQLTINWGYYEPPQGVTYLWSTGETTQVINIPGPGTYSVTLTDPASGCSVVVTENITLIPAPVPVISGTTAICSGNSGTLTVTGGPFSSVFWDPDGWTTETITITQPGIYTVTAYNADGCSATDTFEVLSSGDLPILDGPNTLCPGQTATLSVINASLFTTFNWSDGSMTSSITINAAGLYTVTVTDSGGCSAIGSINVLDNSFVISGLETPNTSCTTPNGLIDVSVTPTGTYNYAWSNGATSQDINNLMAGSYTVIVTDAASCSNMATFMVSENVTNPDLSTVVTDATCGLSNGNIDLSVTPASAYNFSWSNGATSEDINNISAGTYMVTATGSNGCTATLSSIVNNVISSFAITSNITLNTSCTTPNGMIDITVTPTGTYTYAWSNGATSEDINNLMAGSYTIIVTDATSCSSSATFTVSENVTNPSLSTVVTDASCGLSNGNIDLSVTPAGIYTFSWSNGATSEDINNLSIGTYIVTVTGSNGCTATLSAIVNNVNSSFAITSNITPNTSCISPNGMIDVSVTPTGTYTYAWSIGATSEDINNLMAGSYTVIVTDAASCSSSATFTVSENVTNPDLSTVITDATCGMSNGNIDLSVTPTGIYTFSWSNGATSEDISNLSAGTYMVTVTGSNGCTAALSAIINNVNSSFAITSNITFNTSCTTPNGLIDISVTPTGTYTYAWSNGATSEDINNLIAGSYTVIVTDASSCSSSATFMVSNNVTNSSLSTVVTDATCGLSNGNIDLSVTPTGIYTFFWSNGATSEDINNLSAGTYIVTATGSNGCTATLSAIVNNVNSSFAITSNITLNTSCTTPNGLIDISVTPTGSYNYAWSNGATSEDINNLIAGSYTVIVTYASSCSSSATFMVSDNVTNPSLSTVITDATCGLSNGNINLSVIPSGIYTFSWSNGATSEDISNLSAGTYIVTVTGSNGCTATLSAIVNNVNSSFAITSNITLNTSCTSPNGTIDVSVTPIGTYTYTWSNGATSQDINNLMAGSYTVIVTDASSCSNMATFTVSENVTNPSLSTAITDATCGLSNGNIDLSVAPSGIYTFSWSNGATSEDINNLSDWNLYRHCNRK
ncbi:MAG: hypothetical protein IPG48_05905 [Saprospiraceae bacterium]|nr:hypothetical protein [Saprospiraceae bacterium]